MTKNTTFPHITDALAWALGRIKEYHQEEFIVELPEEYEAAEATLKESLLEARYEYPSEEQADEVMEAMGTCEWLHPHREGNVVVFRGTAGALDTFNLKPGKHQIE